MTLRRRSASLGGTVVDFSCFVFLTPLNMYVCVFVCLCVCVFVCLYVCMQIDTQVSWQCYS